MPKLGLKVSLHFGAKRSRKKLSFKVARIPVGSTQVGKRKRGSTKATLTAENRHVLPPLNPKV